MRSILLACCLFVFTAVSTSSAQSADPSKQCDHRKQMLNYLADNYGEVPVAVGEDSRGRIELVRSQDGSTWSLLLTSPEGWSCLLGAGESWRELRIQQSENSPAED